MKQQMAGQLHSNSRRNNQCPGEELRNDGYSGELAVMVGKVKMVVSDAHGRCGKSRVCLWEKTSMLELHTS